MSPRAVSLFPIVILMLLAALTFWLSRYVSGDLASVRKADLGDPDIVVERFVARKMSPDGNVQYVVTASRMAHYPADDSSLLENVVFTATTPNQPTVVARAPRGKLVAGGDEVLLEGGVVVDSSGYGKSPPMRLKTPRMTLLPEKHLVSSRDGVVIESAQGVIRAARFELNNLAQTLKLTRINATLSSTSSN